MNFKRSLFSPSAWRGCFGSTCGSAEVQIAPLWLASCSPTALAVWEVMITSSHALAPRPHFFFLKERCYDDNQLDFFHIKPRIRTVRSRNAQVVIFRTWSVSWHSTNAKIHWRAVNVKEPLTKKCCECVRFYIYIVIYYNEIQNTKVLLLLNKWQVCVCALQCFTRLGLTHYVSASRCDRKICKMTSLSLNKLNAATSATSVWFFLHRPSVEILSGVHLLGAILSESTCKWSISSAAEPHLKPRGPFPR